MLDSVPESEAPFWARFLSSQSLAYFFETTAARLHTSRGLGRSSINAARSSIRSALARAPQTGVLSEAGGQMPPPPPRRSVAPPPAPPALAHEPPSNTQQ